MKLNETTNGQTRILFREILIDSAGMCPLFMTRIKPTEEFLSLNDDKLVRNTEE